MSEVRRGTAIEICPATHVLRVWAEDGTEVQMELTKPVTSYLGPLIAARMAQIMRMEDPYRRD